MIDFPTMCGEYFELVLELIAIHISFPIHLFMAWVVGVSNIGD